MPTGDTCKPNADECEFMSVHVMSILSTSITADSGAGRQEAACWDQQLLMPSIQHASSFASWMVSPGCLALVDLDRWACSCRLLASNMHSADCRALTKISLIPRNHSVIPAAHLAFLQATSGHTCPAQSGQGAGCLLA